MYFLLRSLFFILTAATQLNLIPAVQQYNASSGVFILGSQCCLQVGSRSLISTVQTFQNDLYSATGLNCSIATFLTCNITSINFVLNANLQNLGEQGYLLQIASAQILVQGTNAQGIFYATRTLLQLIKLNGLSIPAASIADFPKYPTFRSLMIDSGRLFYPVGVLINLVKDLSYFKMNVLHLHGMENQNYRIQSASHPEIVATQHYSNSDIAELLSVGQQYFVEIMWEQEGPSHCNSIISKHPQYGAVDINGNINSIALDLTNPAVYTFMENLLNESLTLFSTSKYLHIGGDEWITSGSFASYPQFLTYAQQKWGPSATPQDVYLNYINWAAQIVINANKIPVVWNDNKQNGGVFSVNKNIIFDGWSGAAVSQIQQGYQVINSYQTSLYPACSLYSLFFLFVLFCLFDLNEHF